MAVKVSGILLVLFVTATSHITSGQDNLPVYLSHRDNNYTSNSSEILITEIAGDDDYGYYYFGSNNELTCHTDLVTCCRAGDTGTVGMGEWYYPNGTVVPNRHAGDGFYRLRNSPQAIKLARRIVDIDGNGALGPTGLYCCVIPTTIGEQRFCAHILHCPPLISLNNGVITYNPPDSPEGENTVATYSCNVDYMLIGESTRTCQSDRTWSSIAPYCADSAMIQLKFAPTEHCIQWNENKASLIRSIMRSAIQETILVEGNTTIPLEHIEQGFFSCRTSHNQTTYRTRIIGIETTSAVEIAANIQMWVESGATVRVQWYIVDIDKNCLVSISSLSEPECGQVRCDICIMRGRK